MECKAFHVIVTFVQSFVQSFISFKFRGEHMICNPTSVPPYTCAMFHKLNFVKGLRSPSMKRTVNFSGC